MALDFRPLTLAELLDRSFSLYKRHLWLFVGIMAVPASIGLVYAIAVQIFQLMSGVRVAPGPAAPPSPDQIVKVMLPLVIGGVVFMAVYLTVYAFALGATTIAVARLYREQPVSVGDAYREVRRYGGRLILLLVWITLRLGGTLIGVAVVVGIFSGILGVFMPILSVLVVFVGMIGAFVLPSYLAVRYGVAVPAVVLENCTAGQALARSVQLTEDHRGRVFLLILCAVVITYATALLLQGPFTMGAILAGPQSTLGVVLALTGAVLGTIGSMFSGPIMIVGLAMIYYDIRIRKEALDLQLMLEALDAPRT